MRRVEAQSGTIVAFSFTRGAYEEVARARMDEGLEIALVTVIDLLAKRSPRLLKYKEKEPNSLPSALFDELPLWCLSELKCIKRCAEFRPKEEWRLVPRKTRGIYALLERLSKNRYNVVYVGKAVGTKRGIRGRLKKHLDDKGKMWSHFSIYEVYENIDEEQVDELEGLFRHIYRKDPRANPLNLQRGFKKLRKVRVNNLRKW